MSQKPSTSNDQRANVKNPPTKEYQDDRQNRIELGHPNIPPPSPKGTPAGTGDQKKP